MLVMRPLALSLCITAFAAAPLCAQSITIGKTEMMIGDTTRLNTAERAILHLEARRSKAIADHDTVTLKSIYAADFRGITAIGSSLTRTQLLEVLAQNDAASTFQIDELAIRTLDAARTSAMSTGRIRVLNAKTLDMTRYVHVYQFRDGRWQIIAAHATAILAR